MLGKFSALGHATRLSYGGPKFDFSDFPLDFALWVFAFGERQRAVLDAWCCGKYDRTAGAPKIRKRAGAIPCTARLGIRKYLIFGTQKDMKISQNQKIVPKIP